LESESCGLAAVGDNSTQVFSSAGELSSRSPDASFEFEVAEGAALLRVGLNGQLGSRSGFSGTANDYDLYLRAASAPTTSVYDCADTNPTTFGFCEIASPAPGT